MDAVLADLSTDLRQQFTEIGAGLDNGREQTAPDAQLIGQFKRKIALGGIQQHAGGGNGVLCSPLACQEIVEQVGNEQHLLGACQHIGVIAPLCGKLVERVEVNRLNTRDLIDFLGGNKPTYIVADANRAGIAVVRGVCHQPTVAIQQTVVHAPRVDTHGGHIVPIDHRLGDGILDLKEDPQDVPCKPTVDEHRVVGESMILTQGDLFPVKGTDDTATAGRAEVNRQHFQVCHNKPPNPYVNFRKTDCAAPAQHPITRLLYHICIHNV